MLILFDNGTPAPLRYALKGHVVVEANESGWDRLVNGELIAVAEAADFDLLLTTDKNIRYQQNLTGRKNRFCRSRKPAMADLAPIRGKGSCRRRRGHTGQLHRSGHSVQVNAPSVFWGPGEEQPKFSARSPAGHVGRAASMLSVLSLRRIAFPIAILVTAA